jgi:hypothetical protein
MNNLWHDNFINRLYEKYPKRVHLVGALSNLLGVERKVIYRRLRNNVIFPADEIIKIASTWNISLDKIAGINTDKASFTTQLLNYFNPNEEEWINIRNLIECLNDYKNVASMEYMELSNKLPDALISGFPHLCKYQILKWMHQYTNKEKIVPYSNIVLPDKTVKLASDYHKGARNIANTCYIWDTMLFNYLVRDICYFYSIQLITDEEKRLIMNELYALCDYMLEVAQKGCWLETSNKVSLYISYTNINTNYSYYYSEKLKICLVHTFMKNEIYSFDSIMVEDFRNWMQLKKQAAIQISETNEKNRIEFFVQQRQLVGSLK